MLDRPNITPTAIMAMTTPRTANVIRNKVNIILTFSVIAGWRSRYPRMHEPANSEEPTGSSGKKS
jgi:hypothetical protein